MGSAEGRAEKRIALAGRLWPLFARGSRRHAKAAARVRWHGVGMGIAAILTLWAAAAGDWPMWAIPAGWGTFALLLTASMVAFAVDSLRGDADGEKAHVVAGVPDGAGEGRR